MGTTKLNIFNAALLEVGAGTAEVKILKIDTENTLAGELCRAAWDPARKRALTRIQPREATFYAEPGGALSGASLPVVTDWEYVYKYPESPACLLFLGVIDQERDEKYREQFYPYAIGGNETGSWIACDYENTDIYFKYIFDLTNPGRYSATLEAAIAYIMAELLMPAVANKDNMKVLQEQLKDKWEALGRSARAEEQYDRHNIELDKPMSEIT